MNKKVILGLSGGVDSAVAAALLKQDGYEVIGVFLDADLTPSADAKAVADTVGIEFICHDFKETLEQNVCKYFIDEYLNGRTPNPCIMCNPTSKFATLCDYADKLDADFVATGHYLQTGILAIKEGLEPQKVIIKANSDKDQSYMLCRLTPEIIAKLIFPLAPFTTKAEVREKARELGIPVADKPDSMEICFVPENHTKYIESRGFSMPEGNFVDLEGNVLGRHKGIHNYTVGQRRGLGVSAKTRLFLHKIDAENNNIILSDKDIFMDKVTISNTSFAVLGFKGTEFNAGVKIRYSKEENIALVRSKNDGTCEIIFEKPVRAPASGQSAVFYINNVLIGGGFID
ncbi:MAG: tRNA 2-thiouridine(34) synthase MnmA [Clostridia bacterium]